MQSFAIVPAAGTSSRMGRQKLLLPFRDSTVIEHVLAAWKKSSVTRVVVVVRDDDGGLIAVCESAAVDVVVPEDPPPEMKDSVRFGLQFVEQTFTPAADDVWLLAPADMPELSTSVIDSLLAKHEPQSPAILAPVADGKRGHPVLFPWPLAAKVNQLRDDEGVNSLLQRHPVREITCDEPSILQDLDNPDDYRRLQNRHDAE